MTHASDRRTFLQGALGGLAGLSLSGYVRPVSAASLQSVRLSDDIVLLTGAGTNVVAARDANGVLLVDGGLQAQSAALIELALAQLSRQRVHTLFNTHWHPEQTGANERLGKQGVRIIAHENTRLWLKTKIPLPLGNGTYGPLPPHALPNDTIYTEASLPFGSGQIDYGYLLQAHTDGDLYVYFRDADVLVTGGVVSADGWPIIDYETGGWIGGLVNALRKLVSLSTAQTRIVPANGPVLTQQELQAQLDMYSTIFARLQKQLRAGKSPAEAVAARVTSEYDAQWGDSERFVTMAFRSLWGHMTPDA